MPRTFTWALAAILVASILAAATVAVACTADSEGLELINGELPGGG
jgi:hypothetical protein